MLGRMGVSGWGALESTAPCWLGVYYTILAEVAASHLLLRAGISQTPVYFPSPVCMSFFASRGHFLRSASLLKYGFVCSFRCQDVFAQMFMSSLEMITYLHCKPQTAADLVLSMFFSPQYNISIALSCKETSLPSQMIPSLIIMSFRQD